MNKLNCSLREPRTRRERRGFNRCVPSAFALVPRRDRCAGSLPASLGQNAADELRRKRGLGRSASLRAMSKQYENINSELASWIAEQRMFFVATAPLSRDGHLNISPKGGDSFRVLGPLEVVYQDYTGSG